MSDLNVSDTVNTPVGGDTSTATPAPAIQGTPAAPSATPTGAPASATAQPQTPALGGQVPGAPEGFVPSYRLREAREAAVRQAREEADRQVAAVRAEAERYRQQLQALVGVQNPNQNPEIEAVRKQFSQLYPGLAALEERAKDIQGVLERAGDLESQTAHYWQSYGRQTMDKLFSLAQETFQAPLNEEAKRNLHASFVGFVQASPEMQARYAQDPTIVDDFWKAFSSSFIDPVRRTASAGIAGRAPVALPQDTPGGVPRSPVPGPKSLDDRVAISWAQYQNSQNKTT